MPIKVQCACGAAFAAKDELGGRTVKCPKCQQPLKIPAAGAPVGAAAAPRPSPGPQAPQPGPAMPPGRPLSAPLPSQAAGPGGGHGHWDEVGLVAQQAGTAPCPGCAKPMPVNAVVCIQCGYNKKIGRRMETVKQAEGTALPGGHNVTVDDLLTKAARTIEDEKEDERKKNREGMPWWVYGIGIIGCVGFMITMMLLPREIALATGGVIIWGLAIAINIYAQIRMIMIAFSESISEGILFLVVPCYNLYFIFTHWDQCGGYIIIQMATNIVSSLVQFALEASLAVDEEEAYRLDPVPPAVAMADFDYHPIPLRKT
jgi:hypothetical protein